MYFCVREEYGKICGFYIGSRSIVMLSDLDMIKKVTKYWENLMKKPNLIFSLEIYLFPGKNVFDQAAINL